MLLNATDVKNSFGKVLKMLDYEDVIVTKKGKAVAKIVKFTESVKDHGYIKEYPAEYTGQDRKVTYEEFLKFTANSENRYELINGEIYMLASPKTTHQQVVGQFYVAFYKYFEGKSCTPFISPYDITLNIKDETNVFQPDLGVICDLEEFNNEHDQYMGVPALVVEVTSKSSRSKDYVKKLNNYMLAGVKEYWIIDPMYQNAKVYGFDEDELIDYREYEKGSTIASSFFEGLKVKWV